MKFDEKRRNELLLKDRMLYALVVLRSLNLLFGAFVVLGLLARAGAMATVEWYFFVIAFPIVSGAQLAVHTYFLKEYCVNKGELILQAACLVVLILLSMVFG